MKLFNRDAVPNLFEVLEMRRLLTTASVSSTHVLTIAGTTAADSIVLNKLSSGQVSITGVTKRYTPGSGSGQFTAISITGDKGNDTITINTNVVYKSATISGDAGMDTLTGGNGNDLIIGGLDADKMFGGAGNDVFQAADGSIDIIDGGTGTNTTDSAEKDSLKNVTGRSVVLGGDNQDGTSFSVFGTKNADVISGSVDSKGVLTITINGATFRYTAAERAAIVNTFDYTGEVFIHASGGNDTVTGGAGIAAVFGDAGNDVISTTTSDFLIGGAGNDKLTASGKTGTTLSGDTGIFEAGYVEAGADGNDTITGTSQADNILGGGGKDSLIGGDGNDTIEGDSYGDTLTAGNDTIDGGAGNDSITPGLGTDSIIGGLGNDTADYSDHENALNLSLDGKANDGQKGENDNIVSGFETVIGGSGNDVITGDDHDNLLVGNGGKDALFGGKGNDTLHGDTAEERFGDGDSTDENDFLDGGDGNDFLDGGEGSDTLHGGAGMDNADYSNREYKVVLTLDGIQNDGSPANSFFKAENDFIDKDVENATGGAGDDMLVGNDSSNALSGKAGNDTLIGNGGDDFLNLGAGNDSADGGAGNDTFTNIDGSVDTLIGGIGTDKAQKPGPDGDILTEIEVLT